MKSLQEYIKEACEELGNAQFRESYSGRGMMGESCIGVVGSLQQCVEVITKTLQNLQYEHLYNIEEDMEHGGNGEIFESSLFDEYAPMLNKVSMDNMGYDVIFYWQDLKPIPEEEIDEDPEIPE